MSWLDDLTFNADGLIPAIVQDHATGQILMMAWQNAESLRLTVETGTAVYFSRSRSRLWHKGESSGHTQQVHEIYTDCDKDVIILRVSQVGGIACHTGRVSCFYEKLNMADLTWQAVAPVIKDPSKIYGDVKAENVSKNQPIAKACDTNIISELDKILCERKSADKDSSYVASLYHKGLNKILEKVGEEATEAIIAAKELQMVRSQSKDDTGAKTDLVYEVADTWFHSMVALHELGLSGQAVLDELGRRFGLSGIDEKNSRTIKQ